MNRPSKTSLLPASPMIPAPQRTLRRLFLTLFLRGRSSVGLQIPQAPKSIGHTMGLSLLVYVLIGTVAIAFIKMPVFALAVYLHSMTFAFLGMFLTSSAGAVLFNKEEADILLHRPIVAKTLLWAKISVLLEASLWMAGAFNLVGFFVGFSMLDGGWSFVLAHAISTAMESAFCAACVVIVYQLCLRWCGRERLDGLITTSQVALVIGGIAGSHILPRLVFQGNTIVTINKQSWWITVIPPAWFAGLDDFFSGHFDGNSCLLAALAIFATSIAMWIAFDRLARDYQVGLQKLGETVGAISRPRLGRRWIDIVTEAPPLRWWLRDPVTRSSFLLTTAYLLRDRDVKLRVYPALAPVMIIPFSMLLQTPGGRTNAGTEIPIAFAGSFMSMIPMTALSFLQYSQHWQASDIFRMAPQSGPAELCHGARKAVLCWIALPVIVGFALLLWLLRYSLSSMALLLPGLVALPALALVPIAYGNGVPFSRPVESLQNERNVLGVLGQMLISFLLTGLAFYSWIGDWFVWFIMGESVLATVVYLFLRRVCARLQWRKFE